MTGCGTTRGAAGRTGLEYLPDPDADPGPTEGVCTESASATHRAPAVVYRILSSLLAEEVSHGSQAPHRARGRLPRPQGH